MAKKRKSGTGTVRQRGDGRWEGRVVIGYDDNGLPKTKNVLAKTKRECQEKLRQLTESMVGRNDRKVKSDMLFGDWLCYWYETHSKPTLRASTQNNYENVIHNHVLPEIGKISLNKLSQNDLVQNKHSTRSGYEASETMLIFVIMGGQWMDGLFDEPSARAVNSPPPSCYKDSIEQVAPAMPRARHEPN